jgi:SAM-dependent methyltransferase
MGGKQTLASSVGSVLDRRMASSSTTQVIAYDDATLQFYADEAPVYTAGGPAGQSRFLSQFLTRLQPDARVLGIGCGGGRDAEAMIRAGFEVDATDATPEIAAQAEKRIGQPARVMRFDQLEAANAYDAVWANASLLHVPRAALPNVLSRIFRALRPNGLHFANFKAGCAEGRDRLGRYFNYLDMSELLDVYQNSAPWQVVETEEYIGGGYEGGQGPWVAITVRK